VRFITLYGDEPGLRLKAEKGIEMARQAGFTLRALRTVAAIAAVAGISFQASAATQLCATPSLEGHLSTRLLQTELMVAAIYCGSSAHYNSFVLSYSDQLVEAGGKLRGLFASVYGSKQAPRAWDTFLTNLANEAAKRSYDERSFCARTDAIFSALDSGEVRDLMHFAEAMPFTDRHGVPACTTMAQADLPPSAAKKN
jgi:hypothetical protein